MTLPFSGFAEPAPGSVFAGPARMNREDPNA